jgi:Glycosyl transferase family 2
VTSAGRPIHPTPTLTIVVPALDEEQAIGDTLRRCTAARAQIMAEAGLGAVEIIAVSDGSTDRTETIAREVEGVAVLAFDANRGYGTAIQTGFAYGRGELVGFLDADGTCDPRFFGALARAVVEQGADLALGSRMGRDSEMPRVRAIGNALFAWILGILAKQRLEDTASGMRVIRRSALPDLYPLPAGLHFTPAMSARALLEGRLRLVELPMPYAERVGRSKLHVLRDGVRFLTCIVQAAVAYRPARPLLLAAAALALLALAVAGEPVHFYARHARLEEWMIYRLLLASLLATSSAIATMAAVVAECIAAAAHGRARAQSGVTGFAVRMFNGRNRRLAAAFLVGGALLIAAPGIAEYLGSGHVQMHWSRAVLASLLLVLAFVFGITTFLLRMLDLIAAQRDPGGSAVPAPPDRIHPARAEV